MKTFYLLLKFLHFVDNTSYDICHSKETTVQNTSNSGTPVIYILIGLNSWKTNYLLRKQSCVCELLICGVKRMLQGCSCSLPSLKHEFIKHNTQCGGAPTQPPDQGYMKVPFPRLLDIWYIQWEILPHYFYGPISMMDHMANITSTTFTSQSIFLYQFWAGLICEPRSNYLHLTKP